LEGLSMRPWMIVSSSTIGAIVVGAALAVPGVLHASHPEIASMLLPHMPALVVAALAVYALCAMLLTTATLVAGTLRLRRHLALAASDRAPLRRDWVAQFGGKGVRQLAAKLAPALAQSVRGDGRVVLHARFKPNETRREVARQYYISLARSHFLSVLIVLAGIVGLGFVQDRSSVPFLSIAIPTTSAILILFALALLAVLGRIAVDVSVEPVVEAVSQLPAERVEVGLLRHAVELLEVACNGSAAYNDRVPLPAPQLPDRLVAVIEQSHHALLEAVGRLTANTQTLEVMVQSSLETLETTMRATAAQPPTDESKLASTNAIPELRAAVEELTAVIQGASKSQEPSPAAEPVIRRNAPAPRLARELQSLLQEIKALG
jgi:hypothetical protein